MTRSELIARLTSRYPQLIQKDTELVVAEILGAIQLALAQGNRVEIRGFGTFALNYHSPRIGRNPKTGESVSVPESGSPTSRPASPFENGLVDYPRNHVESLVKGIIIF